MACLGPAVAPTPASVRQKLVGRAVWVVRRGAQLLCLGCQASSGLTKGAIHPVLPILCLPQQSSRNTLSISSLGLNSPIPVYSPNLTFFRRTLRGWWAGIICEPVPRSLTKRQVCEWKHVYATNKPDSHPSVQKGAPDFSPLPSRVTAQDSSISYFP